MRIWKPNLKYANVALIEDNAIKEPSTYEKAAQSKEWRDAMKEQMKALKQNETQELMPQPTKAQPILCKWVYKVRTYLNGSIGIYKA